jgi:hypothetical protein
MSELEAGVPATVLAVLATLSAALVVGLLRRPGHEPRQRVAVCMAGACGAASVAGMNFFAILLGLSYAITAAWASAFLLSGVAIAARRHQRRRLVGWAFGLAAVAASYGVYLVFVWHSLRDLSGIHLFQPWN